MEKISISPKSQKIPKGYLDVQLICKLLDIKVMDKQEGLECAFVQIEKLLESSIRPVVVLVAGGSASGKTSEVASKIKNKFDNSIIISMDDYSRGTNYVLEQKEKGIEINFDDPRYINMSLLTRHINELLHGYSINKPVFSFKTGEPDSTESVYPSKLIIVEGLFSLHEDLSGLGSYNIFVDIGFHGRILRRLIRDVSRTNWRPNDILDYFSNVVEKMHKKHIVSTAKNANLVIRNEYDPAVESHRTGFYEFQTKVKLPNKYDIDSLRKLGVSILGTTKQFDTYYNPFDRSLLKTKEMLRIRKDDSDSYLLTYKGPDVDCDIRKRPKLEFHIEPQTAEAFVNIYGKQILQVSKLRQLFIYDGVVFSIDSVKKVTQNREVSLGDYIEFRFDSESIPTQSVNKICQALGVDYSERLNLPYLMM